MKFIIIFPLLLISILNLPNFEINPKITNKKISISEFERTKKTLNIT